MDNAPVDAAVNENKYITRVRSDSKPNASENRFMFREQHVNRESGAGRCKCYMQDRWDEDYKSSADGATRKALVCKQASSSDWTNSTLVWPEAPVPSALAPSQSYSAI